MAKEVVAMLLAGGQGTRLHALTQKIAKSALPFGGKYRIIDFPLSNCVNSGIDTVGVLAQYQPYLLNEYIGNGQPWDLDRLYGGVHVLQPYQSDKGMGWYDGTANSVYQNMAFIERYAPEYVIILSGDQICKQDYREFLDFHKQKDADLSISVMQVPIEDAWRYGMVETDPDQKIIGFEEKPDHPKSDMASMGIYIFKWPVLQKYLIEDAMNKESRHDFGKSLIPAMLADGRKIYAFPFEGYWKDVGTIESLWQTNMEVLDPEHSGINLFDDEWRIYSRNSGLTGHRIGLQAKVENSMVTDGCKINGNIKHSILFPGVHVAEGALIENSVIMDGADVRANAVVKNAIIGENVFIGEDAKVGDEQKEGKPVQVTTVGHNLTIGDNAVVAAGSMVYADVEEGPQLC